MTLWWILLLITLVSGFTTGLLGIGGALVATYLLMVVPPLMHYPAISSQLIASLVTVQSVFSNSSGAYPHIRQANISLSIFIPTSIGALVGSITGSIFAHNLHEDVMQIIFAILTLLAAIAMFIPGHSKRSSPYFLIQAFQKNHLFTTVSKGVFGLLISIIGGIMGIAANFLFVPFFYGLLGAKVKKALGTSILIGEVISIGGITGRLISGTFPTTWLSIFTFGAVPGAFIGGLLAKYLKPRTAKWCATIIISVIAINTWLKLVL